MLTLMSERREEELTPFLRGYRRVRSAEGWGGGPDYYSALPFRDETGRHARIWRLRSRSYRRALALLDRHFQHVKRADEHGRRALRVLDMGAGNGWLAFRLALAGHSVLATDVSDDDADGLGALRRYPACGMVWRGRLTTARADMECLPLEDGQFDLVVANGSLHYASVVERAVSEAHRLLLPGGLFLVLDSPTYIDERAGTAMLSERALEHRARYGIETNGGGVGFLCFSSFAALLARSGFRCEASLPFEGLGRSLRRGYCRLRRLRPPARFPLFEGVKVS